MINMDMELLVDYCPELFELTEGKLFMRNRKLYSRDLTVTMMDDPIDLYLSINTIDLNRHQIQYRTYDEPFNNIQLTIRFDKVTKKESMRYGLMELLYWVDLTDAECMVFFDQGISIQYPDYVFDQDTMKAVEYKYYEKEIITRRYTINEIVTYESK